LYKLQDFYFYLACLFSVKNCLLWVFNLVICRKPLLYLCVLLYLLLIPSFKLDSRIFSWPNFVISHIIYCTPFRFELTIFMKHQLTFKLKITWLTSVILRYFPASKLCLVKLLLFRTRFAKSNKYFFIQLRNGTFYLYVSCSCIKTEIRLEKEQLLIW